MPGSETGRGLPEANRVRTKTEIPAIFRQLAAEGESRKGFRTSVMIKKGRFHGASCLVRYFSARCWARRPWDTAWTSLARVAQLCPILLITELARQRRVSSGRSLVHRRRDRSPGTPRRLGSQHRRGGGNLQARQRQRQGRA